MAKRGAKSKLTDELINEITTYIENGLSNRDAADLCQITEVTFYRWLKEAEEVDENGKPIPKFRKQRQLLEGITRARAAFKAYHLQAITRASRKSWQASAWLLERKFPDEYAAYDRNAIMAMAKAAAQVRIDDGLVEAVTAQSDNMIPTGDVPDDL